MSVHKVSPADFVRGGRESHTAYCRDVSVEFPMHGGEPYCPCPCHRGGRANRRTYEQLVAWAVEARDHGMITTERAAWIADMRLQDFIKAYSMELLE